jgi:hypothetical protein
MFVATSQKQEIIIHPVAKSEAEYISVKFSSLVNVWYNHGDMPEPQGGNSASSYPGAYRLLLKQFHKEAVRVTKDDALRHARMGIAADFIPNAADVELFGNVKRALPRITDKRETGERGVIALGKNKRISARQCAKVRPIVPFVDDAEPNYFLVIRDLTFDIRNKKGRVIER